MMPIDARRSALQSSVPDGSTHAGLLLDRFLKFPKQDDKGEEALKLLEQAVRQNSSIYTLAYARWKSSLGSESSACAMQADLPVQGRLISGLGIASPLETGIALHHTYGVPWLPGSGLKGLAAHYCATVWGASDPGFLLTTDQTGNITFVGEYYKILFGTTEQSGALVFHDGWWVPQSAASPLMLDVMTPHHGDYYMGAQETATDFDMPVPVSFLSVQGKFSVAVECQCEPDQLEVGKKWAERGLQLLTEALANWGFGGKTSSGYGRVGEPSKQAQAAQNQVETVKSLGEFRKLNDKCLATVSQNVGQFKVRLEIDGNPEVDCKKGNFQIGQKVIVVALEWVKKRPLPTMVAIEKCLD